MKGKARNHARLAVGATVLAAGLALAPVGGFRAHAFSGVCYDDPKVNLSNGVLVQVQDGVTDDSSDITSLTYYVHGPVGTSLVSISDTTVLKKISTTYYVADQPANSYAIATVVTTSANQSASVTVTGTLQFPCKANAVAGSASGTANELISDQLQ